MKKIILLAAVVLVAGLAFAGPVDEEAEYGKLMKLTGGTMHQLRAAIKGSNKQGTIKAADDLTNLFKQDEKFWAKRKVDHAAKISREAQGAARDIAMAARKGDNDKVQSGLNSLATACSSCHEMHRTVGPGGQMKIKG